MTDRLVLGAFDGTFVLRGSRPGFDVLDPSLLPEHLSFDSRWIEAGNIISRGEFVNPPGFNIPIANGLSNPPIVIALMSGVGPDLNTWFLITSTDTINWPANVLITDTFAQISISTAAPIGPGSRLVRYYVCRNIYG
ncbi:hypothetical protein [Nitratireductor pacificus]|uniref:Uncharacterized protein n=1 Tax=Nitratireductor pacificus pht-3B TaxID=391937 RepID=K2MYL5_9HYPH|nr:hypothetical protein [Nitratireductor pacificus]EKF17058.1 hypothetical protein NA2_19848 [Nitratireductor pacificus pht-3B]